MKTIALLCMFAAVATSAQTKSSAWEPVPTFTYTSTPVARFDTKVENGVYTATLTDPNNHWRCYPMSYENGSAVIIACVDTTSPNNQPKEVKK